MVLDLKRIFSGLDSENTFSSVLDLAKVEMDGNYPFVSPVALSGRVTGRSGIFSLEYEARFLFRTVCYRCVEEFEEDYSFSFRHELLAGEAEAANDAYLMVQEEALDLDEVAYTDILLEMPTKQLCGPECLGLCSRCGKNLNDGPCGCKREVDPRLEKLRELL